MKKKRRIIKKITKERLDEFLALVGWSTRHHGAGTYRLYNPYGGCSLYQFSWDRDNPNRPLYDLRIDEYGDYRAFGKVPEEQSYVHAGFQSFILAGCTLEAYSDDNGETWEFVSITTNSKDKKHGSFVCFTPRSSAVPKEGADMSQK